MAAGTVTITDQNSLDRAQRPVRKVSLAWVSDASGDVNGTLTAYLSGALVRVAFVPASGGTQPTDQYDVTLLDEAGLDVLGGQGANRSNAAAAHVAPGVALKDGTTTSVVPPQVDDRLELRVAAAGNAKAGTVILYLR